MADPRTRFAATILVTADGSYVLQVRDNKPGIGDPGKLSLFAGGLLTGEDPLDGALRELAEETTLTDVRLVFYKVFQKDPVRHGAHGTCYVYVGSDVDVGRIDVREGQGYRRVRGVKELNADNTALISYDILTDYDGHRSGESH
jgi:8-oxo-dGTP diphosphatase